MCVFRLIQTPTRIIKEIKCFMILRYHYILTKYLEMTFRVGPNNVQIEMDYLVRKISTFGDLKIEHRYYFGCIFFFFLIISSCIR